MQSRARFAPLGDRQAPTNHANFRTWLSLVRVRDHVAEDDHDWQLPPASAATGHATRWPGNDGMTWQDLEGAVRALNIAATVPFRYVTDLRKYLLADRHRQGANGESLHAARCRLAR